MTVRVSRRETFNAAHQLRNPRLSDDENRRLFGKCVNIHGHNYALDVVVAGEIDDTSGYVLDLKRLSDVMHQQIIQHVDHRNLNSDVPWGLGETSGRLYKYSTTTFQQQCTTVDTFKQVAAGATATATWAITTSGEVYMF